MKERSFVLRQLALLPVGAEVEVSFYRRPKRSAWDGRVKDVAGDPVLDQAVVRDRKSGVVFGMDWHFQLDLGSPRAREACKELMLVEHLAGRVVSCQVVSLHHSTEFRLETWLTVAPD